MARSLTITIESELIKARLTSDSRADALRIVCDNDEEEVWIGDGVTEEGGNEISAPSGVA